MAHPSLCGIFLARWEVTDGKVGTDKLIMKSKSCMDDE